jgi:hypothetical protein
LIAGELAEGSPELDNRLLLPGVTFRVEDVGGDDEKDAVRRA